MATFSEKTTVQNFLADRISNNGFTEENAKDLPRQLADPYIPAYLKQAVIDFNPTLKAHPERYDEIEPRLSAIFGKAVTSSPMQANKEFIQQFFGGFTHKFIGDNDYTTIHLFDLNNPENNQAIVSKEVIYRTPNAYELFDLVLFLNGIPVVIIETKNITEDWKLGVSDINQVYLNKAPAFFATNILNVVCNGTNFRYGSLNQPDYTWSMWGSTEDPYDLQGVERTKRSIDLLLTPSTLINIAVDFTLFQRSGATSARKIIPRYVQMEAAQAIHKRVREPNGGNGLIHHYQGTGKTLLMVYTAMKLLEDTDIEKPTILIGLDRVDLEKNVLDDFRDSGIANITHVGSAKQLKKAITNAVPGIIVTSIWKFKDVVLDSGEVWNSNDNMIVMIDEAHRTQDGDLGMKMRQVIPNARFFGMTGTPINEGGINGRNTFKLFGNQNDPGQVLSKYTMERAIADETSVPIIVEPRLVDWNLDQDALDAAFNTLVEDEGLTEDEAAYLSDRSGKQKTVVLNPDRIDAVCADILDYYHAHVAPLRFKAQVVALDREMCVIYEHKLNELIKQRGLNYTTEVVMTVGGKEDEKRGWTKYERSRPQEHALIDRFVRHDSAPDILIVTSKLLTGFNAPIESTMFIDKPLSKQTLFQAITRTNRRYANPETGQEKTHGIIVDYVGISKRIARALKDASPEDKNRPVEVEEVLVQFDKALKLALSRFEGIDRTDSSYESFTAAASRFATEDDARAFKREFMTAEGLWEVLYPNPQVIKHEQDYKWLAQLYQVAKGAETDFDLVWEKLGAKTIQLVHDSISNVKVKNLKRLEVSSDTIDKLRELTDMLDPDGDELDPDAVTADEILDSIDRRIKMRLAKSDGATVYVSLAEQLENLRTRSTATMEDTEKFIEEAIRLARKIRDLDKRSGNDDDTSKVEEDIALLPDDHVGALTQIVTEYKPEDSSIVVELLAKEIDQIARTVTFSGWSAGNSTGDRKVRATISKKLVDFRMPPRGDLFVAVYEYVAEHY